MTFKLFIILSCAALFAMLAGTMPASAQPPVPPSASFMFPMNGVSGVPVGSQIMIKTSHRIDTGSVTWVHSDGNPSGPDTLFPTVFLIEKDFHDDLPDSVWSIFALPGQYHMLDSVTLTLTPTVPLKWNTEYVAVVKNLRLYNNLGMSMLAPETAITFSTARLPHRLISSNLSIGQTICSGDTFKLQFSRKLDALSAGAGNIVQLKRMIVDSTHQWGDSAVSISLAQSFNSDSTVIHATPIGALVRGSMYMLEVRGDYMTGDTVDHILIPLNANSRSKLTFGKVRYGGGALPASTRIYPDSGDVYFPVGDSIQLMAGYPGEGYKFKYWSSPGNPVVHQNTAASLKILQPCRDVSIQAVFEEIAVDSLRAYADSNGKAVLYSSRWDSLSTNVGRLVHRQDSVWAFAIADFGYTFEKWESADSNYNNVTTPLINIRNDGSAVAVRGRFREFTSGDEYTYCGSIINPQNVTSPLAVLSPTGCHSSDAPGQSGTITATMLDPTGENACYRIVQRIDPNGIPTNHRPDGATLDFLPWPLLKSVPTVHFVISKLEYTLAVNKAMSDNSAVPTEAYVTVSPDKATYQCGESVTLTAFDDEGAGVKFLRWEPSMSTSKTLTLTMNESKSVMAIFESEFRLVSHEWYIGSETQTTRRSLFENALDVQILPISPPSTFMILNFNRPVDQTKLQYDGGNSKIVAVETSRRIDSRVVGFGREQVYTPQSATSVQWSQDGKSVKIRLTNSSSGLSVQKFQELAIYASGLVSTTGTPMKPMSGPAYAHTENPDVIWAIDPLIITYDQDPDTPISSDCGDIFSGWVAGVQRKGANTMTSGRDPSSDVHCIYAPPGGSIAVPLMAVPSVGSADFMSAGIMTIDRDDGEAANQILSVVQAIAGAVANATDVSWVTAPIKLGAQVVNAIAGAMKESGWLGNNDDSIGSADWGFGQYALWGYNASQAELNITNGTAIFKLKVTLQ